MNKEEEIKIVADMQAVVAQMREDDLENNPDSEFELFTCDACGKEKTFAGSVMYGQGVLCNDCVLYAEIGLAFGKIESVSKVVESMEDRKLEEECRYILEDIARHNN